MRQEPFKPFPYQVQAAREIQRFNGRALLALQAGLGKSSVTCMWLRKRPDAFPVVIVCPASVKFVWERHVRWILHEDALVLEGRKALDPLQLPAVRERVLIINYDILHHWLKFIQAFAPRTLVLDEIQNCANRGTLRSKACTWLSKKVEHLLALSGTPLINRPAELYPGLHMIQPKEFNSFWTFAVNYCSPKRTPWGWNCNGASNLGELRQRLLKSCMIRMTKDQVADQLPPKIREVLLMPIEKPHEYERAASNFLSWLSQQDPTRAKRAAKAEHLTRIGYLIRLAAQLKMKSVIEWVNNWLNSTEQKEKIVLFAVHRAAIELLQKECQANSVVIDGQTPVSKRKGLVDQFRHDKNTRIFIGNIKAAGTGLDGLQIAQTLAFAELFWRPGDHAQAEDRIHRLGLQGTAWIYFLIAGGTIEELLCEVIQRKQEVISTTLDGGTNDNDFDVFNQLTKLLRRSQRGTPAAAR